MLQGKVCCSCRQGLLRVQQQLKEATAELLQLRKQSEEHENCSAMLIKIKSEVQQKSDEFAKQCQELQNCNMLAKTQMDIARAKEQIVSLTRMSEQQMTEYVATVEELKGKLSRANEQKWKFCIERDFKLMTAAFSFIPGCQIMGTSRNCYGL